MASGTINTAQAGSFPNLTQGSFILTPCGTGPGILTIEVTDAAGAFSLQVGSSIGGKQLTTHPNTSIFNTGTGLTGLITGNGIYTVPVAGGGTNGQSVGAMQGAVIYAQSLSGGTADIQTTFNSQSSAEPGSNGGGENVNITNTVAVGKAISLLAPSSTANSGLYKTGANTVGNIDVDNASSTTYYLMFFDALTLPADSTAPVAEITVPFGVATSPTENNKTFTPNWLPFATGVFFAWSSTPSVLTHISGVSGLLVRAYSG